MRESRKGVEDGWLVLFDGSWLSWKVRVVIFHSRTVDVSAKMLRSPGGQQEDCQGRRGGGWQGVRGTRKHHQRGNHTMVTFVVRQEL